MVRQNNLLARLTPSVLARLAPYVQRVHLDRRQVLFRAHEPQQAIYFPESAVISLVSTLQGGEMLDVGLVGFDGISTTAVFPGITTMPCDGLVLIPGAARRLPADVFRKAVADSDALHEAVERFAQFLLAQSMQIALCNSFHPVEQRCARWLLMAADLIGEDAIPLTHELLALMLGVRRPSVTLVIGALERGGLVNERRGLMVIGDRRRLERAACECYPSIRREQGRLLGLELPSRSIDLSADCPLVSSDIAL
jgi:CRP-like cAMP-binding protein